MFSRKFIFGFGNQSKEQLKASKQRRKQRAEKKKMKQFNMFSGDFTGERAPHQWLNAKRMSALGRIYEQQRNLHRFNCPVDKKDKEMIQKKMEEFNEKIYIRKIQEREWNKYLAQMQEKIIEERQLLPLHLKNEIPVLGSLKRTIQRFQQYDFNPFLLNQEQILFLMPEEQAKLYLLQRRLAKISNDSLQANE